MSDRQWDDCIAMYIEKEVFHFIDNEAIMQ